MTRRRLILSAILRIAAGLAMSIGIAWFFGTVELRDPSITPVTPPRWPVAVPTDWPESPKRCEVGRQLGFTTCFTSAAASRKKTTPSGHAATVRSTYELTTVSSGWPFRCMQLEVRWVEHTEDDLPSANEYARMDAALTPNYLGRLPQRPLFPGLIGNTVFYAALLGLAAWLSHRLKVWLRTRKGLCPGCKYPFGVSPRCTECGRDISRWTGNAPLPGSRAT